MSSSAANPEESPAQTQARLRRERRQAKIAQGGVDRLAAITGVQGRKAPDGGSSTPMSRTGSAGSYASSTASSIKPSQPVGAGELGATPVLVSKKLTPLSNSGAQSGDDDGNVSDPDHMELPSYNADSVKSQRNPQQQHQQLPFDFGGDGMGENPMKMLQQLLGQIPGNNDQPGNMFDSPFGSGNMPDLASILSGGPGEFGQFGSGNAEQATQPSSSNIISAVAWRIIHAVSAFLLAIFVLYSSPNPFTGTKTSRELAGFGDSSTNQNSSFGTRLFFWFASVQVVLQSSRYLVESKGSLLKGSGPPGMVGLVLQNLPEPWAGYVRVLWRYLVLGQSIVNDGLVIVFVLGITAWWNGYR